MDHALRMGVGHGLTDLLEDSEESGAFVFGALSRRQQGRQRATPNQLHRDEHPAVGKTP